MFFTATESPVTEVPTRSMIDLEGPGGGAFSAEYAVLLDCIPSPTGHLLVVRYEERVVTLPVASDARVPVINYAVSNTLETLV